MVWSCRCGGETLIQGRDTVSVWSRRVPHPERKVARNPLRIKGLGGGRAKNRFSWSLCPVEDSRWVYAEAWGSLGEAEDRGEVGLSRPVRTDWASGGDRRIR